MTSFRLCGQKCSSFVRSVPNLMIQSWVINHHSCRRRSYFFGFLFRNFVGINTICSYIIYLCTCYFAIIYSVSIVALMFVAWARIRLKRIIRNVRNSLKNPWYHHCSWSTGRLTFDGIHAPENSLNAAGSHGWSIIDIHPSSRSSLEAKFMNETRPPLDLPVLGIHSQISHWLNRYLGTSISLRVI